MTTPPPPPSAPTAVAGLSFKPTGIVWCGVIPDWTCTYFIQVAGPDGVVHEGFFENGPVGTPPPAYEILGDVPTELAVGTYRVTFLKQRVSDVSSEVPVAGGTPRITNRSDVFATCETKVEVTGPAHIRIDVAFEESACTARAIATPR